MTVSRMKFRHLFLAVLLLCLCACGASPDVAKRNYVAKGDRYSAEGKHAEAALNYKKAIRKDANYGEAYYKLGLAELGKQDYREAFQAFYRATELLPDNTDAKIKLADMCLSFYLSDARHPKFLFDRITGIADELLRRDPGSYDGLRLQGEIARVHGNPKRA